jgi:fatty acid-binding protein DegV
MVKSGRVSPVAGAIGKILNLKPVITVNNEGKSESYGKPLTEKGSIKLVMKAAQNLISENDIWGYAISHANNLQTAKFYAREIEKLSGLKPVYISDAPPALALNAGPGVVALSIMLK